MKRNSHPSGDASPSSLSLIIIDTCKGQATQMTVNTRHFPRVPFFQSDMVQGGLRHRNFRQLLTEALKVFRRQGHRQHLSTSTGIHQPNRFSRDAQWGLGSATTWKTMKNKEVCFQRFCLRNHRQSGGVQLSEREKCQTGGTDGKSLVELGFVWHIKNRIKTII